MNNPVVEHWDGEHWTRVPTPNPGPKGTHLLGVDAVAEADAWAVGYQLVNGGLPGQPTILHWGGIRWSVVPAAPHDGSRQELTSVSAVSPTDAWAVGVDERSESAVVEHWDGVSWSLVATPADGLDQSAMSSVVALSASDAWAVGSYGPASDPRRILMHWDGVRWRSYHQAPG